MLTQALIPDSTIQSYNNEGCESDPNRVTNTKTNPTQILYNTPDNC